MFTQILAFITEWNGAAHPFNWTSKSFEKVLAKVEAALRLRHKTAFMTTNFGGLY